MNLNELKRLAAQEKWEEVDAIIPDICNDSKYVRWAINRGVKDRNPNVRDLAASLIEKSNIPQAQFNSEFAPRLLRLMGTDKDRYSGFRAACALASHYPGSYKAQVVEVLKVFKEDKDVSRIAAQYLRKLK